MICEKNIEPRRAAWTRHVRLAALPVLVTGILAASGCSTAVRNGEGSSFLTITTLQGTAGTSGSPSAVLNSDVLNVDATTGRQSIASDGGQVAFQLQMKDVSGPAPSPNNAITITQYHVEYVRSDGHNVQGVDVPFAFDGSVTITISDSGSTGFTLVRLQAKQEAPLAALAFGGGAKTISTIAKVTFFGHDQTGRGVSVTGSIEVNFSDFAG
jgi:hypothetical protein